MHLIIIIIAIASGRPFVWCWMGWQKEEEGFHVQPAKTAPISLEIIKQPHLSCPGSAQDTRQQTTAEPGDAGRRGLDRWGSDVEACSDNLEKFLLVLACLQLTQ